ncbi:MAG: HDIG domain-containing protein [Elusimicrobia bacterium]|nr:HDIG domain-containing protein [Elusimicrobiota bacterium]
MNTPSTTTREDALKLLRQHVKSEPMIRHCLASEAVLRALARRLGEDEEKWALAGLLHDVDVELTNADPAVHGAKAGELLRPSGVPEDVIEAIRMHNERSAGAKRSDRFHKALAAGETITGLVMATTLVYPDKKLASVKPSSVVKRMKEKLFAAKVDRDVIRECEAIGIPLADFAQLAVDAMRPIAAELGL